MWHRADLDDVSERNAGELIPARVIIIQLICVPNVNQSFESHSTRAL